MSATADPVVRFEGVSKRYVIGPRRAREEVWALRDVSFEVARGEVFGIVGANGAGKSTLLKLLSRVTPPTAGWIGMTGRLASLLEVGTGFHPELSGRENIFLNGAILGLTRSEVAARFDRIVAFSGVERYLDTPVKRYSSGMYVRLAFAVAAHIDHELMVVDEVLAVGDAAFREKCLAHIEQSVRHEGRTVLFVSHDLSQIARLAPRAMLLERGQVKAIGPTHGVLREYLSGALGHVADLGAPIDLRVEVDGREVAAVESGRPCSLVLALGHVPPHAKAELAIEDSDGHRLWTGSTWLAEGDTPLRCTFAHLPLAAGSYGLRIALDVRDQRVIDRGAGTLKVLGVASTGPLALDVAWSRDGLRSPEGLPSDEPA